MTGTGNVVPYDALLSRVLLFPFLAGRRRGTTNLNNELEPAFIFLARLGLPIKLVFVFVLLFLGI